MSEYPDFPCGRIRHKRLRHDPALLIPLKDYCADAYCTRTTALYRIGRGQIIAYKLQSRWYVLPPDTHTTIGG